MLLNYVTRAERRPSCAELSILVPKQTEEVMEQVYTQLTDRARHLCQQSDDRVTHQSRTNGSSLQHQQLPPPWRRLCIALAGPPGSGKSTVAAEVVKRLNQDCPETPFAAVIPMDGFHLSRATLDKMPNAAEAHARRGVFWTFDAMGIVDLVTALHRSRYDPSAIHKAPGFDHAAKDPVADVVEIGQDIRLVILEGNWLLYDEEPWSRITELVDDTWFVDVDPDLALIRVARRHLDSGIERNWKKAVVRARSNDMKNGELVRTKLVAPAMRVQSVEESGEKEGGNRTA